MNNENDYPTPHTGHDERLQLLRAHSIATLCDAIDAMQELARARTLAKLSPSPAAGAARELRELLKVVSTPRD